MKTLKKIKIYTLIYQGQIVYVGKTSEKYLSSRKAKGYASNKELCSISKECSIELIEQTDDVSRERYWIDRLRDEGHSLLNKYDGNTGLHKADYQRKYFEEYMREYRSKNKEKAKQYNKEYYEKSKALKNENEKY